MPCILFKKFKNINAKIIYLGIKEIHLFNDSTGKSEQK